MLQWERKKGEKINQTEMCLNIILISGKLVICFKSMSEEQIQVHTHTDISQAGLSQLSA
jgi:hypothetical protein